MARDSPFLMAYTWSWKSIDNGSEFLGSSTEGQYAQDYYNLAGERGLSAFDARQRFVLSYVAGLPFGARFCVSSTAATFVGQLVRVCDWCKSPGL